MFCCTESGSRGTMVVLDFVHQCCLWFLSGKEGRIIHEPALADWLRRGIFDRQVKFPDFHMFHHQVSLISARNVHFQQNLQPLNRVGGAFRE